MLVALQEGILAEMPLGEVANKGFNFFGLP